MVGDLFNLYTLTFNLYNPSIEPTLMKGYDGKKWWMEFLISVLGTSIGVGLTFAVTKMVDVSNHIHCSRV